MLYNYTSQKILISEIKTFQLCKFFRKKILSPIKFQSTKYLNFTKKEHKISVLKFKNPRTALKMFKSNSACITNIHIALLVRSTARLLHDLLTASSKASYAITIKVKSYFCFQALNCYILAKLVTDYECYQKKYQL